jgi:hypothetical protein
MEYAKDFLELASYFAVILGVLIALREYHSATRKEQEDRASATYNEVDDKYIEYQMLCLEHPAFDVWDVPDPGPPRTLTREQEKQERQLFTVLFATFERAFLMYTDPDTPTKLKNEQWTGWDGYIVSYGKRENFRAAWSRSGTTFDTKFQHYMEGVMRDSAAAEQSPWTSSSG